MSLPLGSIALAIYQLTFSVKFSIVTKLFVDGGRQTVGGGIEHARGTTHSKYKSSITLICCFLFSGSMSCHEPIHFSRFKIWVQSFHKSFNDFHQYRNFSAYRFVK